MPCCTSFHPSNRTNMFSLLKNVKHNLTFSCAKKIFNQCLVKRNYNELPFEDIPEVSPAIIKKTFKSYNVSFDEGFTCFITSCPLCSKIGTKTPGRSLYINKATGKFYLLNHKALEFVSGMFMCSTCLHSGQWDFLESKYTLKKRKKIQDDQNELKTDHRGRLVEFLKQIRETTKVLNGQSDIQNIFKKLKLPVISSSVIEDLDFRIDNQWENLYLPLENVESEIVGYRKLNLDKPDLDVTIPNFIYGGLLTGKASKNKESAVLVPSIADFLVLVNAKVNQNIVWLPNGVNNLSQYVLPSLERYKKLILWFGNDLKSWDAARHFAKKLGEKRCLFVR